MNVTSDKLSCLETFLYEKQIHTYRSDSTYCYRDVCSNRKIADDRNEPEFRCCPLEEVGADERGMRTYVLAILKTGPNDAKVKGKERDEVFKGHSANITRLAKEGNLVIAGPFDDKGATGADCTSLT